MQISNQLVNTTFSRSSTMRASVCSVPVFSLSFAIVRAFCIFVIFRQFLSSFSIPFFSLFIKHTKCNQSRLYVTKQFCWFHFVVLFISVPTENVRFGYALWSSRSVVFLPHHACAGRQMIKFITLQYASFVLGKPLRLLCFFIYCAAIARICFVVLLDTENRKVSSVCGLPSHG